MPVVKPVSAAVSKFAATSALSPAHPAAVPEGFKLRFPYLEKIVAVDVALGERAVDVGTGGDSAVDQDRPDVDARSAEERGVADEGFIRTDISLAAEADLYAS